MNTQNTKNVSANTLPLLLCDYYKLSHRAQYPKGTEVVYSTWTPRKSLMPGINSAVAFGFQSFIQEMLVEYFNREFFGRDITDITSEYTRLVKHTLFVDTVDVSHLEALHELGYLPIRMKAVAEGTIVPLNTPMLTLENTKPEFFWLTNFLETMMSAELWQSANSATISREYKRILTKFAMETNGNAEHVPFQGHDFSFRGMVGVNGATKSGAAHLTSFVGTDTIPAISFLERYYGANVEKELVGTSIPATEHSVMCAHGLDERESFRKLIQEVYPTGFVSIVSDTWDFWNVIETVIPSLKKEILSRDGKVVIRPDSGDPVKIIVGDENGETELERKGLIEALWDIFGGRVNDLGFKELDTHIGAIYGDSITRERATQILQGLKDKGFAASNIVFGIGSFTFQYNTRDSLGFAMKATYTKRNDGEHMIFKAPKTDASKKSQRGRVVLFEENGEVKFRDGLTLETEAEFEKTVTPLLQTIFEDGKVQNLTTLKEIRTRIEQSLV